MERINHLVEHLEQTPLFSSYLEKVCTWVDELSSLATQSAYAPDSQRYQILYSLKTGLTSRYYSDFAAFELGEQEVGSGDSAVDVRIRLSMARITARAGREARAVDLMKTIQGRISLEGDVWERVRWETAIAAGEVCLAATDISTAAHFFTVACDSWNSSWEGSELDLYYAYLGAGLALIGTGAWEASRAALEEARKLTEQHGALFESVPVYYALGLVNLGLSQRATAERQIRYVVGISQSLAPPEEEALTPIDILSNFGGHSAYNQLIKQGESLTNACIKRKLWLSLYLLICAQEAFKVIFGHADEAFSGTRELVMLFEPQGHKGLGDLVNRYQNAVSQVGILPG